MQLTIKQKQVVSELADIMKDFLPAYGSVKWKGHITFKTIADEIGIGEYWGEGNKHIKLTRLIENTLEHKISSFEKFILRIFNEGMKRDKDKSVVTPDNLKKLTGLF